MASSSAPESPFRPNILAGKVALITGGTSGIGLEIATQLGLHGAAVAVTGRRQAVLDSACAALSGKGIRVLGLQGDVRQQEACDRWVNETVAKFGGLDILVNCAAGNFLTTAEELSQNGFRTVMEIDATGTFTMSRAAYPALRKSRDPCIINISATLHYGATWWQIHVSAAKSAVDSLTRSLALEWGEAGVRVNGVAPGPIEGTAGLNKLAPVPGAEDQAKAMLAESIPLRRLGRKWDIAQACVYLASPAASFISGHTLVVDGAAWMMKPPILPREAVGKVSRSVEGKSRTIGTAAEAPRSKL